MGLTGVEDETPKGSSTKRLTIAVLPVLVAGGLALAGCDSTAWRHRHRQPAAGARSALADLLRPTPPSAAQPGSPRSAPRRLAALTLALLAGPPSGDLIVEMARGAKRRHEDATRWRKQLSDRFAHHHETGLIEGAAIVGYPHRRGMKTRRRTRFAPSCPRPLARARRGSPRCGEPPVGCPFAGAAR